MEIVWRTVRDPQIGITYFATLETPVSLHSYEPTATQIMKWFNRTTRDWVVSLASASGHQVGSSEYVYSKDDADSVAEFLMAGNIL